MTIPTDKRLKRNWSDMTVAHKDTQKWTRHSRVSADQNTVTAEEKVERFQDLALEMKRIHRSTKVTIIPILNGALRTIMNNAKAAYGRLRSA